MMELQTPQQPAGEKAREGTEAHTIAGMYLAYALDKEDIPIKEAAEIHKYGRGYAKYCSGLHAEFQSKYLQYIEQKIAMPLISEHMFGTPDFFIKSDNHTIVVDYKYGYGPVEAYENWQLIAYAAGLINTNNLAQKVSLIIYQPRCYDGKGPVKRWDTTTDHLIPYFNQLRESCREALGDSPRMWAGPHCRYCKARYGCQELYHRVMFITDHINQPFIVDLPSDALAKEIKILRESQQLIKDRLDALEETATEKLRSGGTVPGWGLKNKPGRLNWVKPQSEVIKTALKYGKDVTKIELITPLQAKAFGLPLEAIDELASRGNGKTVLTEVDLREAQEVFGK
jgi:CRISPR/Cas system-associated exonuclease Cas4 (RecB family)